MPNLNVGLSLALGMTTSTHAAEWALGGTDYYVADAGAECYSDFTDYVVHPRNGNATTNHLKNPPIGGILLILTLVYLHIFRPVPIPCN